MMPKALAVVVILLVIGLVVVAFRTERAEEVAIVDDEVRSPSPTPPSTAEGRPSDEAALERPWPSPQGVAASATEPTATATPVEAALTELVDLGPHPPLLDIDGWLQSEVTSLEELRGRVVVVQFWTYGCHNCRATLPNLIELYSRYGRDQVEIVGIHAPEFSHEAEVANIEAAAADLGITWPIALDTGKRTFHSWQPGTRSFWPRTYVLDRDGDIRYDHIGEGQYQQLQDTVAALVADPAL